MSTTVSKYSSNYCSNKTNSRLALTNSFSRFSSWSSLPFVCLSKCLLFSHFSSHFHQLDYRLTERKNFRVESTCYPVVATSLPTYDLLLTTDDRRSPTTYDLLPIKFRRRHPTYGRLTTTDDLRPTTSYLQTTTYSARNA